MAEFKRGLSDQFMQDLKVGKLKVLLEEVKKDHTLCLAIRNDYINIYYRGGNICKVKRKNGGYEYSFDSKYLKDNQQDFKELFESGEIGKIVKSFPKIKHEMDIYFSGKQKAEREFQQLIMRENNNSVISNDTDYFIADIEYANKSNNSRFDMLAVKWPSTSTDRKNPKNIKLAFIEVKYRRWSNRRKSRYSKAC